jgi:hypothetical protein
MCESNIILKRCLGKIVGSLFSTHLLTFHEQGRSFATNTLKRCRFLVYGSVGSQDYLLQIVLLASSFSMRNCARTILLFWEHKSHSTSIRFMLVFNKDELVYKPNAKTITV